MVVWAFTHQQATETIVKREERHAFARDTFSRVAPDGWKLVETASVEQGGNAPVCVVEDDDARRGVFRCLLPNIDSTGIARFYRELRILTQRISQKNVVPLLAWTQDEETQWYINELGVPFHPYWEERNRTAADPDQLAQQGVHLIRQVAEGLAVCHAEGIIHRDIKPKNIVMKLGVLEPWPMIIDFGVAFEEDEERISSANAVGNTRYSPNLMQWRSDEVPPWIDIFELAQTLLWMLEVKPQTHYWNRPVDWRYVQLDPSLNEVYASGVRALAASCSTQEVAPRNAAEMLQLIESLLPTCSPDAQVPPDYGVLADQILIGQSKAKLEEADNQERYNACLPMAAALYKNLRASIEEWFIRAEATLPIKKGVDVSLERLDLLRAKEHVHWCRKTLYELQLGRQESMHQFRIVCQAIPPHRIPGEDGRLPECRRILPKNSNILTFLIFVTARRRPGRAAWITLGADGVPHHHTTRLRDEISHGLNTVGPTTADDVKELALTMLNDESMWQELGR